ncbi:MAG: glycosyltransferase family 2 protein [Blautia sp.]|nr:glycosyltransferase family 2 protein [Blautia sp.]
MNEITVIIPNFNGIQYLPCLMESLSRQTEKNFSVLIVDNGSTDESLDYLRRNWPKAEILPLEKNYGFSYAVNAGIQACKTPLVVLLNNDIEAEEGFVEALAAAVRRHPGAFSCQAKMIAFYDRDRLDGAGDLYCALGWAYARGKGKPAHTYEKEETVFACCAGAAIYRRDRLTELGLFDDAHFAYLEDVDLGYRARLKGYENWYVPSAAVYHVGSGTSGTRHNAFKTRYSSRNNVYLIYKNMPLPQILLNIPFLLPGFLIKGLYFILKGLGKEYFGGLKEGIALSAKNRGSKAKGAGFRVYASIQTELWGNMLRLLFSR